MMFGSNEERLRRAATGQAESEMIGSLLIDGTQIDEIGQLIRLEHFASESLRAVYDVLLRLRREDRPTTAEVVAAELGAVDGHVDELVRAMNLVPHGLHADHHARRVVEDFKRRTFRQAMTEANQELTRVDRSADEVLSSHVSRIEALLDGEAQESDGHISDHLLNAVDSVPVERITTGMTDFDTLLDGGFVPGQLVCVGARPSVGKTAFCSGVALSAAQAGAATLFLSFEMTEREMTGRIQRQFGIHRLDDLDAVNSLAGWPLFVREAAGWSIDRLECEVRRYARRHDVKIVFVDYLSLVRSRDARLPRHEQVADISRSLKMLALKSGLAVVAAQQLSRNIEKRTDRRPLMSDFRESGSIEQDSDILIGIDRPVRPDEGERTEAKLYLMKHRNGETGNLNLSFDPQRTLFGESRAWPFNGRAIG